MHANTINKALKIKHIVDVHYEPTNQKFSRTAIFKRNIERQECISISTFWRYLRVAQKIEGFIGIGSNKVLRNK